MDDVELVQFIGDGDGESNSQHLLFSGDSSRQSRPLFDASATTTDLALSKTTSESILGEVHKGLFQFVIASQAWGRAEQQRCIQRRLEEDAAYADAVDDGPEELDPVEARAAENREIGIRTTRAQRLDADEIRRCMTDEASVDPLSRLAAKLEKIGSTLVHDRRVELDHLKPETSTPPLIDEQHGAAIVKWKSRAAAHLYVDMIRAVSIARHQLLLPSMIATPCVVSYASHGSVVTVSWLLPLVATGGASLTTNEASLNSNHDHLPTLIEGLFCKYFQISPDPHEATFQCFAGTDATVYVVPAIRMLRCRLLQTALSSRIGDSGLHVVRFEYAATEAVGLDCVDQAVTMRLVPLLQQHALPLVRLAKSDTKWLSRLFHACGVGMKYLLKARALLLQSASNNQSKGGNSDASKSIAALAALMMSEAVARTLKSIAVRAHARSNSRSVSFAGHKGGASITEGQLLKTNASCSSDVVLKLGLLAPATPRDDLSGPPSPLDVAAGTTDATTTPSGTATEVFRKFLRGKRFLETTVQSLLVKKFEGGPLLQQSAVIVREHLVLPLIVHHLENRLGLKYDEAQKLFLPHMSPPPALRVGLRDAMDVASIVKDESILADTVSARHASTARSTATGEGEENTLEAVCTTLVSVYFSMRAVQNAALGAENVFKGAMSRCAQLMKRIRKEENEQTGNDKCAGIGMTCALLLRLIVGRLTSNAPLMWQAWSFFTSAAASCTSALLSDLDTARAFSAWSFAQYSLPLIEESLDDPVSAPTSKHQGEGATMASRVQIFQNLVVFSSHLVVHCHKWKSSSVPQLTPLMWFSQASLKQLAAASNNTACASLNHDEPATAAVVHSAKRATAYFALSTVDAGRVLRDFASIASGALGDEVQGGGEPVPDPMWFAVLRLVLRLSSTHLHGGGGGDLWDCLACALWLLQTSTSTADLAAPATAEVSGAKEVVLRTSCQWMWRSSMCGVFDHHVVNDGALDATLAQLPNRSQVLDALQSIHENRQVSDAGWAVKYMASETDHKETARWHLARFVASELEAATKRCEIRELEQLRRADTLIEEHAERCGIDGAFAATSATLRETENDRRLVEQRRRDEEGARIISKIKKERTEAHGQKLAKVVQTRMLDELHAKREAREKRAAMEWEEQQRLRVQEEALKRIAAARDARLQAKGKQMAESFITEKMEQMLAKRRQRELERAQEEQEAKEREAALEAIRVRIETRKRVAAEALATSLARAKAAEVVAQREARLVAEEAEKKRHEALEALKQKREERLHHQASEIAAKLAANRVATFRQDKYCQAYPDVAVRCAHSGERYELMTEVGALVEAKFITADAVRPYVDTIRRAATLEADAPLSAGIRDSFPWIAGAASAPLAEGNLLVPQSHGDAHGAVYDIFGDADVIATFPVSLDFETMASCLPSPDDMAISLLAAYSSGGPSATVAAGGVQQVSSSSQSALLKAKSAAFGKILGPSTTGKPLALKGDDLAAFVAALSGLIRRVDPMVSGDPKLAASALLLSPKLPPLKQAPPRKGRDKNSPDLASQQPQPLKRISALLSQALKLRQEREGRLYSGPSPMKSLPPALGHDASGAVGSASVAAAEELPQLLTELGKLFFDNFTHLEPAERDECIRLRDQAALELKREQLFLLIRSPSTVNLAKQAAEEMITACSKVPSMAHRGPCALLVGAVVSSRSPAKQAAVSYAWRAVSLVQVIAAECVALHRSLSSIAESEWCTVAPILSCRINAVRGGSPGAFSAASDAPSLRLVRRLCRPVPDLLPTSEEVSLITTPGAVARLLNTKTALLATFSMLSASLMRDGGGGQRVDLRESVEWATLLFHDAFDVLAQCLEANEAYVATMEMRRRHCAFARETCGERHMVTMQCESAVQNKQLRELALVEELVLRRQAAAASGSSTTPQST